MERLSPDDEVMLWPDALWPQEVGAIAILDGGPVVDRDGRVRVDDVRALVESRLHLVPRFRQLLVIPRRGLGGPLWIDAPSFDVAQHVTVVPLPAGGDEAALLRAVERLRRQRLDRTRPLWQMTLLPGLQGGRVGLFVKVHHAVADGIAAMAAIGASSTPTPTVRPLLRHRGARAELRHRDNWSSTASAGTWSTSSARCARSGTRWPRRAGPGRHGLRCGA